MGNYFEMAKAVAGSIAARRAAAIVTQGKGVSDGTAPEIPSSADSSVLPGPAPERLARAGRLPAEAEGVEISLRWYCSTCGADGVVWHFPELTCDAKEAAIIRAHDERAPGCRRLDYRVVSDSETRPRREAA